MAHRTRPEVACESLDLGDFGAAIPLGIYAASTWSPVLAGPMRLSGFRQRAERRMGCGCVRQIVHWDGAGWTQFELA